MAEPFPPDLLKGTTELMVLAALAAGPLHGYALIQRLRERSAGRCRFREGSLYPLLHRLEAERLLRAREEATGARSRKVYTLERAGQKRLQELRRQWSEFRATIDHVIDDPHEGAPR